MIQTENKARYGINRAESWIGCICYIKMWFVRPGIQHGFSHAPTLFKAMMNLGGCLHGFPGHFVTRTALDDESSGKSERKSRPLFGGSRCMHDDMAECPGQIFILWLPESIIRLGVNRDKYNIFI